MTPKVQYNFCIFLNEYPLYIMDFKSDKAPHKFLRKGEGKRISNKHAGKPPRPYLKKGAGKLASEFHGETEFAIKRKEQIVQEQLERELNYYKKKDV